MCYLDHFTSYVKTVMLKIKKIMAVADLENGFEVDNS